MIVIYAKQRDEFVNNVIDYLQNVPFFRISNGNGFEYISSIFEKQSFNSSLIKNRFVKTIDIEKLDSIWFNGGMINLDNNHLKNSKELNELLFQNFNLMIEGLLKAKNTSNIGSINNNKKTNKIYNLLIAKNIGLQIPETLITKNKEELLSFINTHSKEGVICKRINELDSFSENEYLFDNSKTFLITNDILNKLPNAFGISFFQQRIKKRFEIRTIFFNDTFYSSAIFDISNNVDYRTSLQTFRNKPRIVPYNLPKRVENKLRKFLDKTKYTFCSIDLIYSNKDEYIFLEINPSGQISFINNACNFYLEKEFAKYLKKDA